MRKVVVNNIVSRDGFYSDASGNPLGMDIDAAFDRANLESIDSADIIVWGATRSKNKLPLAIHRRRPTAR